jgi:hypothetical protein
VVDSLHQLLFGSLRQPQRRRSRNVLANHLGNSYRAIPRH